MVHGHLNIKYENVYFYRNFFRLSLRNSYLGIELPKKWDYKPVIFLLFVLYNNIEIKLKLNIFAVETHLHIRESSTLNFIHTKSCTFSYNYN